MNSGKAQVSGGGGGEGGWGLASTQEPRKLLKLISIDPLMRIIGSLLTYKETVFGVRKVGIRILAGRCDARPTRRSHGLRAGSEIEDDISEKLYALNLIEPFCSWACGLGCK